MKLSIQESIDRAKQNPNSDFATFVRNEIESGNFDEPALKQGVDLTKFGRPSPQEVNEKVLAETNQFEQTPEEKKERGFLGKTKDFIVGAIGGGKLAEGAGKALAQGEIQKLSEIEQRNADIALDLQKRIIAKRNAGEDTSRLENALTQLELTQQNLRDVQEDFTESLPSNREVIGSATRLAGTVGAGALATGVAKGGVGFQSAKNLDKVGGFSNLFGGGTQAVGAGKGAIQGAKIGASTGATEGAIQGLGAGIEQDELGVGGVVFSTLGGGVLGAGLGGTIGAITGGVSGKMKASQELKKQTEQLLQQEPDARVAKYIRDGQGKIQTDPVAKEAIKQGVDEGVVATVKGSTPVDKTKMAEMVDILERGRTEPKFGALNRPSDVVGDTALERLNFIRKVNQDAGSKLDDVAKGLKGNNINTTTIVDDFADQLDSLDVSFRNGKLSFERSAIEGIEPAEKLIKKVTERMQNIGDDAFEWHKLKKFIDEQVSYGKAGEGLSGSTERVVKQLRSSIDDVLDNSFPAYNTVNTDYSTTRGAIDAFGDVAGKKFDPTSDFAKAKLGTLMRRIFSNAQSRTDVISALQQVQDVAENYGMDVTDDIVSQAIFVNDLERLLPPRTSTSIRGEFSKALQEGKGITKALRSAEGIGDLALELGAKGLEKAQGINEEGLIKSLRELLK